MSFSSTKYHHRLLDDGTAPANGAGVAVAAAGDGRQNRAAEASPDEAASAEKGTPNAGRL